MLFFIFQKLGQSSFVRSWSGSSFLLISSLLCSSLRLRLLLSSCWSAFSFGLLQLDIAAFCLLSDGNLSVINSNLLRVCNLGLGRLNNANLFSFIFLISCHSCCLSDQLYLSASSLFGRCGGGFFLSFCLCLLLVFVLLKRLFGAFTFLIAVIIFLNCNFTGAPSASLLHGRDFDSKISKITIIIFVIFISFTIFVLGILSIIYSISSLISIIGS